MLDIPMFERQAQWLPYKIPKQSYNVERSKVGENRYECTTIASPLLGVFTKLCTCSVPSHINYTVQAEYKAGR